MADELSRLSRLSGFGNRDAQAFGYFHGFDHHGVSDLLQLNRDGSGYIFFTQPILNLTSDNILQSHRLHYLTDNNPSSMACAIRSTLMRRDFAEYYEPGIVRSNLVDDKQAFIPFLSNSLLTLTGWPDEVAEMLSSAQGKAKQEHFFIDQYPDDFSSYNLTATFMNKEGNPIVNFFSTCLYYAKSVRYGSMVPFPEMIAERELDYTMNVFVLIMDEAKKYVQNICQVGGMEPTGISRGATFNYDREKRYNDENNQITVPFKFTGVMYDDPRTIDTFNAIALAYNRDLDDRNRESNMIKLSTGEKTLFKDYGYPRINPQSAELEWWVSIDVYNSILAELGDVFVEDGV